MGNNKKEARIGRRWRGEWFRAGDDNKEDRPAMMRRKTGRALRRRKRTGWGRRGQ